MDDRTRDNSGLIVAFLFAVMACFFANIFLHFSTLMTWIVFFSVLLWMINSDVESEKAIKIQEEVMAENRERRKKDEEQRKQDDEEREKYKKLELKTFRKCSLPKLINERAEILSQIKGIPFDKASLLISKKIEEKYKTSNLLHRGYCVDRIYKDAAEVVDFLMFELAKTKKNSLSTKVRSNLKEYFKSKNVLFFEDLI